MLEYMKKSVEAIVPENDSGSQSQPSSPKVPSESSNAQQVNK